MYFPVYCLTIQKIKKDAFFLEFLQLASLYGHVFTYPPKGEGKQADVSAAMAGMEMIFGTNTTRVTSHTMSL